MGDTQLRSSKETPEFAFIEKIAFFLPDDTLTNEQISRHFPEWSVEKISAKTGVMNRHVAGSKQFVSDMTAAAARKLFEESPHLVEEISYVILCTQSPDFFLPTTACLVQDSLGLPTNIGAIDVNQGCSGYVYSIGLAKALIENGQAKKVLVLTGDTYTKLLNSGDKSVRTIFGDAATATVVGSRPGEQDSIRGITYGTDGSGAGNLIVPRGGLRGAEAVFPRSSSSARGLEPGQFDLYMDGPAIFNFTLSVVPEMVENILKESGLDFEDIDLFVVHQANAFMLEHLRQKIGIPPEKFPMYLSDTGNTVSSTIPIALHEAERDGRLTRGMRVMVMGFGVGLSWAGMALTW